MNALKENKTERPPVVALMGHIDHGKSTILSYIRKNTKALNEAGDITQHVSAYEVMHKDGEGRIHHITFLDTPGHEAFSGIRKRGAVVADIVLLVVSATEGVKMQTIEALKSIRNSKTPFIVVINKIDKPEADILKTKQSLAENEIYVEGYGGDIPVVEVSGKTGKGIPELLDMILLVASLSELTGNQNLKASGIVIESSRDIQKGISAVCIIKNGTMKKGEFIASGKSIAPVRIIENYLGKQISESSFSSPVKIIGWDSLPEVGETFEVFDSRDEAIKYTEKEKVKTEKLNESEQTSLDTIPIIVKADTGGSLEAVLFEIKKLTNERISAQIISSGIGAISENDIRLANGNKKAIVVGFNIKIDNLAKQLAERNEIEVEIFTVIYKMSEKMKEILSARTPKKSEEESTGIAKVLKIFSKVKDRQIIGAHVEVGRISVGAILKIKRRDVEVGTGKIRGLELQKKKVDNVDVGKDFGTMVEAKIEIAPGDKIESFIIVEK
jgi:translation initiation factor IF-2